MTIRSVRSRREQDDVDDAVGRLDLRPLVALEDVLDDERMESERPRRRRPSARATVRPGRSRPPRRAWRAAPAGGPSATSPGELAHLAIDERGHPDLARTTARGAAIAGRRRVRRRDRSGAQRMMPGSGEPSAASIRVAVGRAPAPVRRQDERRRDRRDGDDRRHEEQPDHDRGRLARRPALEGLDDQRVAQRAIAQLLRDVRRGTPRAWRRPRPTAGRSWSSRRRSAPPARRPCRASGPRSRPTRPPRTPRDRPPRPPPSSAA